LEFTIGNLKRRRPIWHVLKRKGINFVERATKNPRGVNESSLEEEELMDSSRSPAHGTDLHLSETAQEEKHRCSCGAKIHPKRWEKGEEECRKCQTSRKITAKQVTKERNTR